MRIRIKHETRYAFDRDTTLGPHIIRLCPATHARAELLSYNLDLTPECSVRWQYDPWGNRVARLTFPAGIKTREFGIVVDAAFDIRPVNPFDFFTDDRCLKVPFDYPDGLATEVSAFLPPVNVGPLLREFIDSVPFEGVTNDYLVALNSKINERIDYVIRPEPGLQTSEQTLTRGRGSCRDFAVVLVEALRSRGLAARFVSGYSVQLADEGAIPDLPKGVTADVMDLHAWAEVYLPGAGWIGLDGTSGLLCGEGHIPLASAVDPALASPVDGTMSECKSELTVTMEVIRLGHEPRPRVPYTDEQWAELLAAGDQVDERLAASGLTLTCGGEPTWTSREHPHEPEWNTEALGATKLSQGLRLMAQLRGRFGDGPAIMHRMGKHYPGESLPRWMFEQIWRADGVPVWRDPKRLDLQSAGEMSRGDIDAGLADATRLGEALAARLGVPAKLHPGYEDAWHFIMEEQNLPVDVDPLEAGLDDPEDRRRLARILDRGLARTVGFAMPLARTKSGTWITDEWAFRREHLYLIPGESPMGLRLPLDKIEGPPPELWPEDVTEAPGDLDFDPRQPRVRVAAAPGEPGRAQVRAAGGVKRTAIVLEPREQALYVFLPPTEAAEDFLELVAAVEDAAADTDLVVRLEGYPPPADPRLRHLVVAPDPGVIEVNVPPSLTLREYSQTIETVGDAARYAGLTTEKYQLDGREVGSGGGNHVTLGGPTTTESPFLIRPDLLGSLLRYIQNHPSLSYLFTGQFVGPTSQAPRVDEARHDSLYELELALQRIPIPGRTRTDPHGSAQGDWLPPWLTDRMFRNLLVDLTGNTHRAEVCIDKLYSPHGPAGRHGIVEFRAFEMPPNERMCAAQMLVMRSLLAKFVRQPYEERLVRWGTQLHDKFFLPQWIWSDFKDVIRDLREEGLPTDEAWWRPFVDFRFPIIGNAELDGGVNVEVRTALEPWNVLGEEPTGGAVSRYVDSSVERLQVRVTGLTEGRHVVTVNGVRMPLSPTGRADERVAGVRFRAWQPPHCLQPHIGIHHPLRFDVIDTWGKRAIGAATYHVWHPQGRGFDEVPLMAFEAAARRAQRFTTIGHAPWPAVAKWAEPHPDEPWTIDLRRFHGDRPMPRDIDETDDDE